MAAKGQIKQKSGRKKNETVADLMTPDPVALLEVATLTEAAREMRERNIGDVLVLDDTAGRVKGVVTDRDIVVRGLAEGMDPEKTTLSTVCSEDIVYLEPTDTVEQAIDLMRDRAIRRIPVVEGGKPVGIVSLGDLAVARDPDSALADISDAPANA